MPGEWGFPFDFIPHLPFAPAEISHKFEIHLENNFLIDVSVVCILAVVFVAHI